jgi:hypothetical protein
MALSEAEVDEALAEDTESVVPLAGVGLGGTGPKPPPVVPAEARKRREVVSKLLATGVSDDGIILVLGKKFNDDGTEGMNLAESTVRSLMSEVRKAWKTEDDVRAEFSKPAAVRRHLDHIRKASRKGAYNAVAMLESNLMKIEGNASPIRVDIGGDIRLTSAIMHVLGEFDEGKVRELVDGERERLMPNAPKQALPAKVVSSRVKSDPPAP